MNMNTKTFLFFFAISSLLVPKMALGKEAVKWGRTAPVQAVPSGVEVPCPNYLSAQSDQNFLALPEGFTIGSIQWSKTICQGNMMACEYEGVIKIFKDISNEYSWCQDHPTNSYVCLCSPK